MSCSGCRTWPCFKDFLFEKYFYLLYLRHRLKSAVSSSSISLEKSSIKDGTKVRVYWSGGTRGVNLSNISSSCILTWSCWYSDIRSAVLNSSVKRATLASVQHPTEVLGPLLPSVGIFSGLSLQDTGGSSWLTNSRSSGYSCQPPSMRSVTGCSNRSWRATCRPSTSSSRSRGGTCSL